MGNGCQPSDNLGIHRILQTRGQHKIGPLFYRFFCNTGIFIDEIETIRMHHFVPGIGRGYLGLFKCKLNRCPLNLVKRYIGKDCAGRSGGFKYRYSFLEPLTDTTSP